MRWILTAAHCFTEEFTGAVKDLSTSFALIGCNTDDRGDGSHCAKSHFDKYWVDPNWTYEYVKTKKS